ncbi:MAG: hypothetical protein H6922_00560 [Pseudomonadaceae bacterium]|nr:hypothetical protein [Pseudomonadaceae bacterium]
MGKHDKYADMLLKVILSEYPLRPRDGVLTKKAHLFDWQQAIQDAFIHTQAGFRAKDGAMSFSTPLEQRFYKGLVAELKNATTHQQRLALIHTALTHGAQRYDELEAERPHNNPDPEAAYRAALADAEAGRAHNSELVSTR